MGKGERRVETQECPRCRYSDANREGIHATRGLRSEIRWGAHARHHVAVVHAAHITRSGARARARGEFLDRDDEDEKIPADGAASCSLRDDGWGKEDGEA